MFYFKYVLLAAAVMLRLDSAQATSSEGNLIGYNCHPTCIASTIPSNESSKLSFGQYYAVLNLDVENAAVFPFENTTAGKDWIDNLSRWIDAVHAQDPPPLSIYTAVSYINSHRPELGVQSGKPVPFYANGKVFGAEDTRTTGIFHAFPINESAGDVVLSKARYYAGAGNQLEEILRAQKIDTVILSGVATYGAVLATAFQLFDLDYDV